MRSVCTVYAWYMHGICIPPYTQRAVGTRAAPLTHPHTPLLTPSRTLTHPPLPSQALNQQYATSLSTQEQLQSAYATLKEAHKQQASQMLRLQASGSTV